MKTSKEVTKLKNAVARAAGTVERIKIELLLAESALSAAKYAFDKAHKKTMSVKSGYTLHVTCAGVNKINVIKAIRRITNFDLKKSKDVADAAGPPSEANRVALFDDMVKLEEAERILQEAGATVKAVASS